MNNTRIRTSIFAAAAVGAFVVGSAATASASAEDHVVVGHTYEATNNATGNAIAVFDRYADGSLKAAGQVATGGLGAGASLNSQGGVTRDGNVLFVVNAGDDSVSALAVTDHGLELRDRIGTRGDFPVSVTVKDGVGYVLNQGSDTIRGFRYDSAGHLQSLPGSTRSLTPNPAGGEAGAAEVSFTPDGRDLVVTEKATNLIDTFTVRGWVCRGRHATRVGGHDAIRLRLRPSRARHRVRGCHRVGLVLPDPSVHADHQGAVDHAARGLLGRRGGEPRLRRERSEQLDLVVPGGPEW